MCKFSKQKEQITICSFCFVWFWKKFEVVLLKIILSEYFVFEK